MYALQSPSLAATPLSATSLPTTSQPTHAETAVTAGRTYFFVTAEADCNVLLRVLQSFARLGVTPYRVHSSTEQGTGEEMTLELRIKGSDPAVAERLAALSRTVMGVHSVIMAVES
jgi:hypothetical protein